MAVDPPLTRANRKEYVIVSETIQAWHFMRGDRKLQFTHNNERGVKIRKGQTLTVEPPLGMCYNGLHASIKPLDALGYCPPERKREGLVICRVELSGQIKHEDNKLCAERRKVLWWARCENVLHEFACLCAEDALALIDSPDPRSAAAIKAKREWVKGVISDEQLAAAREAAKDAAWAAAGAAAREAAKDAAREAAWNAARDAAREAARDGARDGAGDAAWAAAKDAQNKRLESMFLVLNGEASP